MGKSKYDNGMTREERLAFWFDANGNKRCSRCKLFKPVGQYHKDKNGWEGLCYQCKECAITSSRSNHRRRMKDDPEYRKAKDEAYLLSRWGFGREEYDRRLYSQNGCAICGETSPANWHLDHCHSTGQVREFLCGNCNRGLGQFQDNQEIMMKAIEYLRKHRAAYKEGSRQ